jgi:hypothetical protein
MFAIPIEPAARMIFLVFVGMLGVVLVILTFVYAEVLIETAHAKLRKAKSNFIEGRKKR